MKYENIEKAEHICKQIDKIKYSLRDIDYIKNKYQANSKCVGIHSAKIELDIPNPNQQVYGVNSKIRINVNIQALGIEFLMWAIDRKEKYLKGSLLELEAELEKL